MSKEKQIEEIIGELRDVWIVDWEGNPHNLSEKLWDDDLENIAIELYNIGYRKQSEGEWVDKPTQAILPQLRSEDERWCGMMKKCEDCIHDGICNEWAIECGIPFVNADLCEHYQNKAEFVGDEIYPLTIIADRYCGTYSGGLYTAWNLPPEAIPDGVEYDGDDALDFWEEDNTIPYGKGRTANEAVADLYIKLKMKGGEE